MMVLYSGTTCPYSHRCRFVLFEKGMDFEIRDVDLFAKPEDIALMNPYNEVPILVERDLILYESHIINEYIDERFPHPQLMPGDPVARARVRLLLFNFEKELFAHVNLLESRGAKATDKQLERWVHDITHHTFVHEDIKAMLEGFRYDAHPMGMLLSTVGAMSTFYPDAKEIDDPEERYMAAIRLIAKLPTLAAFSYRHSLGLPYVYPDNDLSYAGNFLAMMRKMTEVKYEPDPRLEKALDVLFILHADHEQNCSTSSVRAVGSSQVDPYSAVAAGVAALYGPLHGGANEAVLRMLRRIETTENIPDFLEGVKKREEKLMGFGHRVYKNYDPRARIIKKHVDAVLEVVGVDNPLLSIASELEKRALDDEFFTERKLYPNVDYYSGLIYEALGIPADMFTVIFAIPRTSGWIAQWMEMNGDAEQKIARPRQIYTGKRDLDYTPIGERDGADKITGPPARRPAGVRLKRPGGSKEPRPAGCRATLGEPLPQVF